MRTITQEDAVRNPAFAKYVGQTLTIKEINEIETKKATKETKPANAAANDPKDPANAAGDEVK
jgi:hypothetical protein